MAVTFTRGQELGRGDIDIFLTDANGNSANPAEITFGIYYVDPGPPEAEVLIGPPNRVPANPEIGEFYAPLLVPAAAQTGTYRIRWRFRRRVTDAYTTVVQEWAVLRDTEVVVESPYSQSEMAMISRLRILLRDQDPARNYRFMPPEHEGDVGAYNRVFGHVWEDYELLEYLRAGLDWWNSFPPETEYLRTLDVLVQMKGTWKTSVMWAAIVHAMFALTLNWSHERFSYSIGGISLDIDKASGYESLKQNAEGQLDKATEAKMQTTKIIAGLKQPRFGVGVRSSFGPPTGRGTLGPRSFVG